MVLSGAKFNLANNSTLVAMVTSAKKTAWPSDVALQDLDAAGLRVACIVKWRLTTVPNGLISRTLGKLGGLDRLACEREFANMIS